MFVHYPIEARHRRAFLLRVYLPGGKIIAIHLLANHCIVTKKLFVMEVRKEDFPVVIQAFETNGATDVFVAEQVVNSQADINTFTSRYTGKLIKARRLTEAERGLQGNTHQTTRKRSAVGTYILIAVILIIVALVIVGFTTGWIQQTFHIGTNATAFNIPAASAILYTISS
jgi:hypothetical protein